MVNILTFDDSQVCSEINNDVSSSRIELSITNPPIQFFLICVLFVTRDWRFQKDETGTGILKFLETGTVKSSNRYKNFRVYVEKP